ncbi:hypothetical protein [Emticicia sp. BO119]|uniref:hypothetical protein n=1 Tax=Emticicia sp. BO119 TaxID=2757768 RepID=UPI0015F0B895|nr:hypothetical protein [Emticicia sp. BO119]MBA4848968.1 hypothetical protein [Emticicia sp. BO119]
MKSKLAENPLDVLFFAKSYDRASGNTTNNLSYLDNARPRMFYDTKHQFLGGYVVSTTNQNQSLRYYDFLSFEQRSNILKQGYKEEECAEITFIFFEKHTNPIQRLSILIRSLFEARAKKKKYILGGGVVTAFNNRMRRVLNVELYNGEVLVFGKVKPFKILCVERKHFFFKMFTAFLSEVRVLLF